MSSGYQIQLQYNRAMQQASRLEELANQLSSIGRKRIGDSVNSLRTGWTGENGEAFRRKEERLKTRTEMTAQELRQAAAAVRTIATNTYQAEMRALEIARRRTYGSGGSGGGGGR